jgi:hypothetical protein
LLFHCRRSVISGRQEENMHIYLRSIFPFSGEAEQPSKINPFLEIVKRKEGEGNFTYHFTKSIQILSRIGS